MNYSVKSAPALAEVLSPQEFPASSTRFSNMTDDELVLACQQKQAGAIEFLLKRHEKTIARILRHRAPDIKDNSDLIQEVSIKIWRSIPLLRNRLAFRSWVNQIVTNVLNDEFRKPPRSYQLVSMDEPHVSAEGVESGTRDIRDHSPQPEESALGNELAEVLALSLSKLSENFRTAVTLRDVDGRSYEEIATMTGTELGTVKSRIARARVKVQALLRPYMQSSE